MYYRPKYQAVAWLAICAFIYARHSFGKGHRTHAVRVCWEVLWQNCDESRGKRDCRDPAVLAWLPALVSCDLIPRLAALRLILPPKVS